jgi:hypothetical protein
MERTLGYGLELNIHYNNYINPITEHLTHNTLV